MVEATKDNLLKKVYVNLPKIYFILQIVVGVWAAFWILFNHQPKTGDDVEHLHSAWLVYQGQIPYVDFFQHHNPLLWYLFAPLLGMFSYDIVVFDIVRTISTLVMFLTLFMCAKIVQNFICFSWYAGLLTVAAVFPSYIVLSGQDFRPDNYMVCAFMVGLYFFFEYLKKQRGKSLIISFAFMFITFMFMQKSIFFLALFGLSVLYLLYTKQVNVKDFLQALILPLTGSVFFILWLAYHHMVDRYWLCNFIFNLHIPEVYGNLSEHTKPEFYVLTAIAGIGFLYFIIKGNTAARIICLLWVGEAIQRFFYFSLDRHYYYFLDILNAILAGAIAWQIIKKWQWSAYIFILLSIYGSWLFRGYCIENKLSPEYHRYVTPKYVIEHTNKCDSVLNGYGLTYGIFTKDNTYYWNLNGQLDVIGQEIDLAPIPNLNAIVEKHLPKIIYTGPFWHERLHKQGTDVPVHWINSTLRDKYYQQSLFINMFILKPEYEAKRRCRYNAVTKSWEYFYKE